MPADSISLYSPVDMPPLMVRDDGYVRKSVGAYPLFVRKSVDYYLLFVRKSAGFIHYSLEKV